MSTSKWTTIINYNDGSSLVRIKVPGGWLYEETSSEVPVFVPRPPGYKDSDDDPGWRDVKDAPRTGVRIIIWVDADGDHVYIARHNCVYPKWEVEGNCLRCIHDEDIKGWMPLPVMYKDEKEN